MRTFFNFFKINKINFYLFIIIFLFWFFRLENLGFDNTNNDSTRWMMRSEAFLQALKDGNFSETNQKYHPGVSLMLINGFSRQIFYIYQYNFLDKKVDLMSFEYFGYTNLISKFVVILVIFFIVLIQIKLISILWNKEVALWYFFMISIEPYFIGINRWFHLTSLEVFFGFTAILLLLVWRKLNNSLYFVCSSIFLALAVLTKVTSIIIGLVIFVILIENFLKHKKFSYFVYYLFIYLGTLFILFPALWTDSINVSTYIFNSIFNAVGDNIRNTNLNGLIAFFYYIIILLLKMSPITLGLFFFALFKSKNIIDDFYTKIIYFTFLSYFIFLTISEQKIDRYSLVFYLPIFLISAIYLSNLKLFVKKIYVVFSLILIFFVYFSYSSQYSAFYNPLIGGTNLALKLGIYENGGNFYYNSAEFLNKNFPKSRVFVPDNFEAFSFFYNGKTINKFDDKASFVISSLDIDRQEFNNYGCLNEITRFGPPETAVLKIFQCK